MALVKCKECGAEISKKAAACLECGEPKKKGLSMGSLLLLGIIGLVLYVVVRGPTIDDAQAPPVVLTVEQTLAREAVLVAELKTIPASDYLANLERYKELVGLVPDNTGYTAKVMKYAAEKDRQALISYQFEYGENGAHKNLQAHVLKNLKDPASYEHIKSRHNDKGDHILVALQYRAKNSFGGYVVDTVKARCTLESDCTLFK